MALLDILIHENTISQEEFRNTIGVVLDINVSFDNIVETNLPVQDGEGIYEVGYGFCS
jgi:hypothetical protein